MSRQSPCSVSLLLFLFCLPLEALAQDGEDGQWSFWASAFEEYRFRMVLPPDGVSQPGPLGQPLPEEESDHVLRMYLNSGVIDPSGHFRVDLATFLWLQADSLPEKGEPTSLGSIYQYAGVADRFWIDAYSLSAEYSSENVLKLVRVGRQVVDRGLPIVIDGLNLELFALKPYLEFFIFGGRSVYFFKVDEVDLLDNWMASGGMVIRPLPSLRLELDYRFLWEMVLERDKTTLERVDDHNYGLSLWFRHDDWFYLRAYVRGLNDMVAYTGATVKMEWVEKGLGGSLGLDAQPATLRVVNELDNPYYAILGESLPNIRWHLDLWKDFLTPYGDYALHAGWWGRNVVDGEPGPFNRNVGRVYLLFQAIDIGVKGPFVSLTGEVHYTYEDLILSSDLLATVGASAGYDWKRTVKAEVGTYYQRFKYDYYQDVEEIEDVRVYYGEVSYKALDWLRIRGRYEFQRFDRDLHVLCLTLYQNY